MSDKRKRITVEFAYSTANGTHSDMDVCLKITGHYKEGRKAQPDYYLRLSLWEAENLVETLAKELHRIHGYISNTISRSAEAFGDD